MKKKKNILTNLMLCLGLAVPAAFAETPQIPSPETPVQAAVESKASDAAAVKNVQSEAASIPDAKLVEAVKETLISGTAGEDVQPPAANPAAELEPVVIVGPEIPLSAAEAGERVLPGDMEVPAPGPKPGSPINREGLDIEGVGLTTHQKPFITQHPKEPVESMSVFPADTSQIFWFAFFKTGRTNEERMVRPKFAVQWYAPGDQLVYSGTFRANIAYPDYVRTRLPIATLGMEDYYGQWRVRVTSGEKLVDERKFTVAKPGDFQPAAS